MVRVGFGSDSHRFERSFSKPLILGGVRISDAGGLEAHSDGDVVLHAFFNALSQATGGESLGYYADPLYRQGVTDSRAYLKVALDMVRAAGCRVHNVGIMIEAARPRFSREQIAEMKTSVARLAGTRIGDVGITFTSGEGLTAFGRGEGILAQVIVSLEEV